MRLKKQLAEREGQENAPAGIDKTLKAKRETSLDVDGTPVIFCEYEDAPEGDFVKICSDDHEAGVAAEYAWFAAKYPGAVRIRQRSTRIKLNGTQVRCDILTLNLPGGGTRDIYFDISQMMADLDTKIMKIMKQNSPISPL
jgi:hypothetical protein